MRWKPLEVRDRATTIAILAARAESDNLITHKYLAQTGYYSPTLPLTFVLRLYPLRVEYNPYVWRDEGSRTVCLAHKHLTTELFHEYEDGDVIDIEYLQGEKAHRKTPELL